MGGQKQSRGGERREDGKNRKREEVGCHSGGWVSHPPFRFVAEIQARYGGHEGYGDTSGYFAPELVLREQSLDPLCRGTQGVPKRNDQGQTYLVVYRADMSTEVEDSGENGKHRREHPLSVVRCPLSEHHRDTSHPGPGRIAGVTASTRIVDGDVTSRRADEPILRLVIWKI
jgi:hypothetical protein